MNVQVTYPFCRLLCILGCAIPLLSTRAFAQSSLTQAYYPGLTISGTAGNSYDIQYVNTLSNVNDWVTLTNLTLPTSPFLFIDTTAPGLPKRFYRDTNGLFTVRTYAGLTIAGNVGSTNLIQYVEALGNTNNWTTLTTVVLPSNPYLFFDTISPAGASRRYRAEDVAQPPEITSVTSVLAQVGTPFAYQITASSYLPITSYDASGLPAGLTINSGNGLISGSPTQEGTNAVTITARNSSGEGNATLTLNLRTSLATPLVSIPAGLFTMGSSPVDPDATASEQPQTQVAITHSFLLGQYEVSQAEYQAVIGSNQIGRASCRE